MILPVDLIFEILTFFFLVAVTLAVSNIIEHFSSQRRRLGQPTSAGSLSAQSLLKSRKISNPFLLWVQSSTSIRRRHRSCSPKSYRQLASAGFARPAAPIWYVIIRFSLAIGLPLGFLLSRGLFAEQMDESVLIFWTLALCGFGLLAPSSFISRRANQRREELEREFPDALDLMVVCVEAGLSLNAAFVRVGQEMKESHSAHRRRVCARFSRNFEPDGALRTR